MEFERLLSPSPLFGRPISHDLSQPANPNAGVILMNRYHDLHELLEHDQNAKRYFNNLPDDVRAQVTRAGGVNSYESLREYAENLLRRQN